MMPSPTGLAHEELMEALQAARPTLLLGMSNLWCDFFASFRSELDAETRRYLSSLLDEDQAAVLSTALDNDDDWGYDAELMEGFKEVQRAFRRCVQEYLRTRQGGAVKRRLLHGWRSRLGGELTLLADHECMRAMA